MDHFLDCSKPILKQFNIVIIIFSYISLYWYRLSLFDLFNKIDSSFLIYILGIKQSIAEYLQIEQMQTKIYQKL